MTRNLQIHPYQTVVRTGEGEGADQAKERVVRSGPEDPRIADLQRLAWEDVIGAQVAWGSTEGGWGETIKKVGRIEGRVSQVQRVGVTLHCGLLGTTWTAGRDFCVDKRMVDQLLD